MKPQVLNHSEEAMALLTLYKAMNPKTKEEVRSLIIEESEVEDTKTLTRISFDAWSEDWVDDPEENELWENFYKKRSGV